MTYIENIFVCIAGPLLLVTLYMGKKYYGIFFFCIAGMGVCLLSAYINTFFAKLYNADFINATTQIAPVVEEIMKLLPLLFYLLVFEPKPEEINKAVLIVATSFATFENICYLIENGAAQFSFILVRGFGTGAMHIVCGAIASYGLVYVWQHVWLRIAGTFGLLGTAITFHAIYNLLIAHGGITQYIAYSLPVLTMIVGKVINEIYKSKHYIKTE
ncbi:MAG TPA: PrsW family glutamic-type intramembrane protease [Clostridia bacterium]|nr:PrsW family glutamic-type intramembrane protease [Clostridia bacterium]